MKRSAVVPLVLIGWSVLSNCAIGGESNSGNRPHPVGGKKPNPFRLYDIYGNLWQWCHDWSDYDWPRRGIKGPYYAVSPRVDPRGPKTGRGKVVRGGSFDFGARSAFRVWGGGPNNCRDHIGFRVAMTIQASGRAKSSRDDRNRGAGSQTSLPRASTPPERGRKRAPADSSPAVTLNRKDDGYRGIWYMNQPTPDQYGFKYSGGLGTYCAKHKPFAVYCPKVDKTFFCYGGTTAGSHRRLVHMVSYYDHKTGRVPRPTVLLDKQTSDAHDNPVIAVDDDGCIWIFSTAHGTARPAYIHRSRRPYDIDEFELVRPTRLEDSKAVPMTNFSYMQAWYVSGRGFVCFFTRYGYPVARTICFMTSPDGVRWSRWQRLATIGHGHYQISAVQSGPLAPREGDSGRGAAGPVRREKRLRVIAGSAFNYHPRRDPRGSGANWRTNLYYVETADFGRSWQAADGTPLQLPLTEINNPALVHDYAAEGLNIYLKDIRYDDQGRPIILYLTSKGPMPGPKHGPRTWWTARWTGSRWAIHPVTTSDNNYDMGSLWLEADGTWRVIAPTEPAAQPYATGGEVAMWVSRDRGQSWQKVRQLTSGSQRNHTYVRRPVNAHPDFYAFWADGDALKPSISRLYFCNKQGQVRVLPLKMQTDSATPEWVRKSAGP